MSINSILDNKEYDLLVTVFEGLKIKYPTSEDAQEWLAQINSALDIIKCEGESMKRDYKSNIAIDRIMLLRLVTQKRILRKDQEKIMQTLLNESSKIQDLFDELDKI